MGVKFTGLLPKREIRIEELKDRKIAVDTSQMLYQFLSSIRQKDGTPLTDKKGRVTSHIMGLSTRIPNLMNRGLKLCFVFDGKPPILKSNVQIERMQRKKIAEERFYAAKEKGDTEEMYKYAKQSVKLTKEFIEESKELIAAFGLPVIQAPAEAEAQASFMCRKGGVWAVASSDHDCLLYKSPRLITSLTLASRRKMPSGLYKEIKPELIELEQVLRFLKIDESQLLAMAILIGTDYNKGISGYGPKRALERVRHFKSFEQIFNGLDINWKEIKKAFEDQPVIQDYELAWKKPDKEKIKEILLEHDFSEEKIESVLAKFKENNQKMLRDFLTI